QQAGLLDVGQGVGGHVGVPPEQHGDLGMPAVVGQINLLHPADRHLVDLDVRLRHQIEHVPELDLHLDRVVTEVGSAGQRQVVDTGERATPGDQQGDRGEQRGQYASGAHHWPPPYWIACNCRSGGGILPFCSELISEPTDGSASPSGATLSHTCPSGSPASGTCLRMLQIITIGGCASSLMSERVSSAPVLPL